MFAFFQKKSHRAGVAANVAAVAVVVSGVVRFGFTYRKFLSVAPQCSVSPSDQCP